MKRNKGFTLIELLVVMAILAVIIIFMVPEGKEDSNSDEQHLENIDGINRTIPDTYTNSETYYPSEKRDNLDAPERR